MAGSGTGNWRLLLKEQWQQSSFIAQQASTPFSAMVSYLKANCFHAVKHILIFSALTREEMCFGIKVVFPFIYTLSASKWKKEKIMKRETAVA